MKIEIIEQGIWPNDKPSEGHGGELWVWYKSIGWCARIDADPDDGFKWIVVPNPEKALEDHTEAELIEKWVKKFGADMFEFNPQTQTLSEALIKDLK